MKALWECLADPYIHLFLIGLLLVRIAMATGQDNNDKPHSVVIESQSPPIVKTSGSFSTRPVVALKGVVAKVSH
jgi:hypothetical protein